tara:strand:+ start:16951 stop:18012 length:1062 start_codon:yes stop_codon:yes gene_type:complete
MKRKFNNIFIIGSPWHAYLAKLFFGENDKYIIEYSSKKSLKSIKNSIQNKENILKEVNVEPLYFRNIFPLRNFFSIKVKFSQLQKFFSALEVKNIYYFNTESFLSLLIRSFNKNHLAIKIEDGVCDYLPFPLLQISFFNNLIKTIVTKVLGVHHFYYPANIRKIERGYFFFPDKQNRNYPTESLLDFKEDLVRIIKNTNSSDLTILDASNSALVIGQTLFEDRYCEFELEIEIYKKLIKSLKHKGFNKIYFKFHPRSSVKKIKRIELLKKEFSELRIIDYDGSAECLMITNNFNLLVGFWSNTVIYSKPLFDIDSYTIMFSLLEKKNNKFINKIAKVMSSKFPKYFIDFRKIS